MIETREVLAAAYVGGVTSSRPMVSHAVRVDATGRALEPVCSRVRLDSLAEPDGAVRHIPPTCPACQRRLRREARYQRADHERSTP